MNAKSTTLSIRVSAAAKKKLDALAKSQKRSKSFLAAEAIDSYLEYEEWQRTEIEKGIAEVEAGDVVTGAEMTAWIAGLRNKRKKTS